MRRPVPREKVGDLRQFASVRLVELADGAERGVRALVLSSGGGLDAWVMVDRSFDIGPVWHRGIPVAWQSNTGFRSPFLQDAEGDGGYGFARSFSGFLVTCGLDHIREPAPGHPQHGRLPFAPARLLAYGEDWERDDPVLFCEGEVLQARYGGEALRLRRRVEMDIGGTRLRIADRIENLAADRQAHAILYHFNLGWPAIDDGASVVFGGEELVTPIALADPGATPQGACRAVGHAGWAECEVRPAGIRFGFSAGTLPFLQTWHDLRPRAGVLAVEPCTSMRDEQATSGEPVWLEASELRDYAIDVTFGL